MERSTCIDVKVILINIMHKPSVPEKDLFITHIQDWYPCFHTCSFCVPRIDEFHILLYSGHIHHSCQILQILDTFQI